MAKIGCLAEHQWSRGRIAGKALAVVLQKIVTAVGEVSLSQVAGFKCPEPNLFGDADIAEVFF